MSCYFTSNVFVTRPFLGFAIVVHKYVDKTICYFRMYSLEHSCLLQNNSKIENICFTIFFRLGAVAVTSNRAGLGKTLYKRNLSQKLKSSNRDGQVYDVCIPLQQRAVDVTYVMDILQGHLYHPSITRARILHIDISPEVKCLTILIYATMLICKLALIYITLRYM